MSWEVLLFQFLKEVCIELVLIPSVLVRIPWGALGWLHWLSVWLLVSAQVMISQFCEFEPCIGLCAGSAEPAWDSLSFSLSLCPSPAHALSVSFKINFLEKIESSFSLATSISSELISMEAATSLSHWPHYIGRRVGILLALTVASRTLAATSSILKCVYTTDRKSTRLNSSH